MNKILLAKIDKAIALIARAEPVALRYRDFGMIVAFSGGKDSQVIYELTKMAGVRHILKHNFTTMDAPEVVRFIREQYPECIIERPEMSFWQLCVKHRMLPDMFHRWCCHELKEGKDPLSVTITGVRRQESVRRSSRQEVAIYTRRRHPDFVSGSFDDFEEYRETQVQCIQGKDKIVVNPILDWSAADVFAFLSDRGVRLCSLYASRSRIGCLFCPLSSTKNMYQDAHDYPKHYAVFIRLIGRVRRARIEHYGYDIWQGLTDAQVFDWWASKKKLSTFICEFSMPKLDF